MIMGTTILVFVVLFIGFVSGFIRECQNFLAFWRNNRNGKRNMRVRFVRYCYHVGTSNIDFYGIVVYRNKLLEIGYEHDETRFVGFILKGHHENEDEFFMPFPTIDDIEIIGNIYQNSKLIKSKRQGK